MHLSTRINWMTLAERSLTLWAMTLVVSGHMLPSGSAAAQDVLSLSIPVNAAAEPTPVDPPASATPAEVAPVSKSAEERVQLPIIQPAVVAAPIPREESKSAFDEWTVTIRPAPKRLVAQTLPQALIAPIPTSNVKVPVNVQVNNAAPQIPLLWNVNSTYSPWWQAPTDAYLFRRPQPYWQLRGDFFHLAPFINW